MAAERVTTAAAIENAYEAELRIDTDVSSTIDMLIRIFDSGLAPWHGVTKAKFGWTPSLLVWDANATLASRRLP